MPETPRPRPAATSGAARREAARKAAARHDRLRRARIPAAVGIVVVVAAVAVLATRGGGSGGAGTKVATVDSGAFTAVAAAPSGADVDGIPCETSEKLTYHVHAHLSVYVGGTAMTIPNGIGISHDKGCIYWLHTHTPDGIVHVEAPDKRSFTLGELFDVWGQPLDVTHVASAEGATTVYVDGRAYTGDVRKIALDDHVQIQLDVGTDVAPVRFSWPYGY